MVFGAGKNRICRQSKVRPTFVTKVHVDEPIPLESSIYYIAFQLVTLFVIV